MSRDWDAFIADFRKMQKRIARASEATGKKLKSDLQADLKAAWAKEDALRAAIKTAKAGGVEGDKPKDFRKDKAYGAALDAWQEAVAAYRRRVDAMKDFARTARETLDDLRKLQEPVEKAARKSKESGPKKKAVDTALKEAGAAMKGLKKSVGIYGTLKAHEVFYAARLKASVEAIHKDLAKKPGKEAALARLIRESTLRKNAQAAGKMQDTIDHLCEIAREEDGRDKRKAAKSLSLAGDRLKDLARLNDQYQTVKTKLKKAINASRTKGFTLSQIASIEKAHAAARDTVAATGRQMA